MNGKQLQACLRTLESLDDKREFYKLQREADELMRQSWVVRKKAWAFYRAKKIPDRQLDLPLENGDDLV